MASLIELYPEASVQDILLYFKDTLIWCKDQGWRDWELCQVTNIQSARDAAGNYFHQILLNDLNKPNARSYGPDLAKLDVLIEYPEPGYLNWKSTVVYVSRPPARQNQKGICWKTVKASNKFGGFLLNMCDRDMGTVLSRYRGCGEHVGSNAAAYLQDLKALLTSDHPITPIPKAWDAVTGDSNYVARAIGRQFALSRGTRFLDPDVWFGNVRVGTMPEITKVVTDGTTGKSFFTEVSDFFLPQGIEVTHKGM